MIHRLGLAAPVHAQLIRYGRISHMHETVAHLDPGLAHFAEPEGAPDVVGLGGDFNQHLIWIAHRFREVQLAQLGLRIERVHVPRPALQD